MKSARITCEVHNEMDSFVCGLNSISDRRGFIAERILDFHFLSPLENVVPVPNLGNTLRNGFVLVSLECLRWRQRYLFESQLYVVSESPLQNEVCAHNLCYIQRNGFVRMSYESFRWAPKIYRRMKP